MLKVVEIPMAHGFAFTAIRSGTGIGVEVSSRGGSLTGKNTSWMRSQRLAQMGSSWKAFPRKESSSWPVTGTEAPWSPFSSGVMSGVMY